MKRPPLDHDIGILQFLESLGQSVEFLHPPRVGLAARRDDRLQIDALVAESAAPRIGGVVEMSTDRHQPALAAVVDRQAVHRLGFYAALAEIGVVQADHGWPVPGLVERILAASQFRPRAEVGELARDQPLLGLLRELLQVVEDRPCLGVGLRIGWLQGIRELAGIKKQDHDGQRQDSVHGFIPNGGGWSSAIRAQSLAGRASQRCPLYWTATWTVHQVNGVVVDETVEEVDTAHRYGRPC
ncbi:MAG: hypothetical protein NTY19_35245 [Planctomycetota bacterium]|nr:hypothetical protein [Planctomycetota bacterium]